MSQRGHACDPAKGHGFIDSQKRGMEVFRTIPPHAPLVVVEAVWQYSHHILHGLYTHQGPILTVANWSGQWPGPGRHAEPERFAHQGGRHLQHPVERGLHGRVFPCGAAPVAGRRSGASTTSRTCIRSRGSACRDGAEELGRLLAAELRRDKAIMGVFDEGCMGMYNAIIPDELLHPTGVFKERLSQSALFAEMQQVPRRRGARGEAVAGFARHEIRHRTEPRNRSHRGSGAGPVRDVHRRPAHRRRFRLRHHRHPIPAGSQGPGPGQRPCRRPAQQRGPSAGDRARQRPRALRGQRAAALQ